jgi:hypothetical protein
VLYRSGYADDVMVHHGNMQASSTSSPQPYTVAALARKLRQVLDGK